MLKQVIKPVLAAAAIATAGMFAAAPAQADAKFGIYIGNGYGPGIYYGNAPRQRVHRVHKRHACKPRHALRKAWHIGVNRPHVSRVNNKRIVVRGFNYGHPAKVVFKRTHRGCKIIKTRGI